MNSVKKWAFPTVAIVVVAASLLVPGQLSAFRDRRLLEVPHVEPLMAEELADSASELSQRLELLSRAIRYPELEVYSSTQPLDEDDIEEAEIAFHAALESLSAWGILPEISLQEEITFLGGSRAIYIDSGSGLSAGMLYLQGNYQNTGDLWLVVDEETDLPVWIDCTLRETTAPLPSQEMLCRRFLDGLGLRTRQLGNALFVLEDTDGVVYGALTDHDTWRISIEPMGFEQEIRESSADDQQMMS